MFNRTSDTVSVDAIIDTLCVTTMQNNGRVRVDPREITIPKQTTTEHPSINTIL
jgi:hypothetical protein